MIKGLQMKTFKEILSEGKKVKVGSVTIDTNNDFQRQLLNQSELDPMNGLKTPLTVKQIEDIAKKSKKYWKDGGVTVNENGKKVWIGLNYLHPDGFYAGWNYDGWASSSKDQPDPNKAVNEAIGKLKEYMKDKRAFKDKYGN